MAAKVRTVFAELGLDGLAERIFKNHKRAVMCGGVFVVMHRRDAVTQVRRKIWLRDNKTCTHCGKTVPWSVMELHERIWRGRGGEVSVANGTTLCTNCHQNDPVAGHGERKIQWT